MVHGETQALATATSSAAKPQPHPGSFDGKPKTKSALNVVLHDLSHPRDDLPDVLTLPLFRRGKERTQS